MAKAKQNKILLKYERRTRLIQELVEELSDENFLKEVTELINSMGSTVRRLIPEKELSEMTHSDIVQRYFEVTSNNWSSVQDIRIETGVPRGAIANVFYKTHRDEYESKPHPNHKSQKLWRKKA